MDKIVIIGGGPGGYASAIEAKKFGADVTIIEKDKLGGICLNYGCIPTKSIISSCNLINKIKSSKKMGINSSYDFDIDEIIQRKDRVVNGIKDKLKRYIKSKGIEIIIGKAEIISSNEVIVNNTKINADYIIIATGSKPILETKSSINPEKVFLSKIKSDINILGGGYIGCEYAYIFKSLGYNVNIYEKENRLLPFLDEDVSFEIKSVMELQGINIILNYNIEDEEDIEYINCCGRVGNIPETKVELIIKDSFINVDENLETNIKNIFAIGDVNGHNLLASHAEIEGKSVVNYIYNKNFEIDFSTNPSVIFTEPNISFFGLINKNLKSSKAYFKFNQKAISESEERGFVKLFVDLENNLKGAIILGEHASEMINQLSFFSNKNINEIRKKMFFHPSYSETIKEAIENLFLDDNNT